MNTVLHIIDTTGPGGAEEVFLQLARGLDSARYRSIALISGPGWVKSSLEGLEVTHFVKDCDGSFNIGYLGYLLCLIKREKVDLIQAHLLGSSVYASVAGGLLNVPVVATIHGKVDIGSQERWLKAKLFLITRFSKRIICVSASLKQQLLSILSCPPERVVVIQNGIEAPAAALKQQARGAAVDTAAPEVVALGALGNIREAKAYHIFVRAVAVLRKRGIPVVARVAGEGQGPLLERLLEEVEEQALQRNFEFVGFTDQPDGFLAQLDYYVLSSSSEGHPLALSQAMMLGLPIIATRCGVEDILEHGVDAWIVDKDDPVALADGIAAVLCRADRGAGLGVAAKNKAQSLFGLQTMLDNYQQEYQTLLASGEALPVRSADVSGDAG